MNTDNRVAECKWGPFDAEQWGIPDGHILVLRHVNGDYKVHITKLLRNGDLPKRFRTDGAVLGWYNFVVEFHPGVPLMNNEDEWTTVAYHMWYPKSEGVGNEHIRIMWGQEIEDELTKHIRKNQKPTWMQSGSDIDDMDGEHDPSDNWKR